MNNDSTEYPPLEPTVPASDPYTPLHALNNPYDSAGYPPTVPASDPYTPSYALNNLDNLYSDLPLLPPPPPPGQRHIHLAIPLVSGFCLIVLSAGFLTLLHVRNSQTPIAHIIRKATLSRTQHVTPTPLLSPQPTPSPQPTKDPNYTATEILSDFNHVGCSCGYGIMYGVTIWTYSDDNYFVSVHAISSAVWIDPPQDAGAASVGLWVYATQGDAQSAYTQVGNDETNQNLSATPLPQYMVPAEYLHGRCLLLITGYDTTGGPPWNGYEAALDQYCI